MPIEPRLQGLHRRTRSELIGRGFADGGRRALSALRRAAGWLSAGRLTGLRAGLTASAQAPARAVVRRQVRAGTAGAESSPAGGRVAQLRADMAGYIADGRCGSYDGFLRNYDRSQGAPARCPAEEMTGFIQEDSGARFRHFGALVMGHASGGWAAASPDRYQADRLVLLAIEQALDDPGCGPLLGADSGALVGSLAQGIRDGSIPVDHYLRSNASGQALDAAKVRPALAEALYGSAVFNRGLSLAIAQGAGEAALKARVSQTLQSLATRDSLHATAEKKWATLEPEQRQELLDIAHRVSARLHARIGLAPGT